MNFYIDDHIHTSYSGHTDSDMTVSNIIDKAEQAGITRLVIAEHAFDWYCGIKKNIILIKKELNAVSSRVRINVGIEIDPDSGKPGHLVFDNFERGEFFPVMTGFHGYPGTVHGWFDKIRLTASEKKKIYRQWLCIMEKLAENPKVDIFSHPGRIILQNNIIREFTSGVMNDMRSLAQAMRQYSVAFEVNDALLGSILSERLRTSYREVIVMMMENGVKLTFGSNAHSLKQIGNFNNTQLFMKGIRINEHSLWTPIFNAGEAKNGNDPKTA